MIFDIMNMGYSKEELNLKNLAKKYRTEYYKNNDVPIEWHYICVDDQTWEKNIEERNKRIEEGNGGSDFHVGEGLKNKVLSRWIEPTKEEIDIWINLER